MVIKEPKVTIGAVDEALKRHNCRERLEVLDDLLANSTTKKRVPAPPPPPGGIGLREAERKYGVAATTISGWRRKEWLRTLLDTRNTTYVDEKELLKLIKVFKPQAKRGTKAIKRELEKSHNNKK